MGRKSAVKRDREIAKLRHEVNILSTRFAVLSGGYRVLREEKEVIEQNNELIEARLANVEDALAKAISRNFSMARAIGKLQILDTDRTRIINLLDGRINKLEKPIGLWTKIKSCVFGRK